MFQFKEYIPLKSSKVFHSVFFNQHEAQEGKSNFDRSLFFACCQQFGEEQHRDRQRPRLHSCFVVSVSILSPFLNKNMNV